MAGDVGVAGVAISLLLVALAGAISVWQRLGVERTLAWSAARCLVQLLVVGAALALVIEEGRPIALSWAWVAVIVGFAAVTVRRRAPEVPEAGRLALTAFALATAVSLGIVLGLGVFPVEGRVLVPVSGMIVGNSLNATVLVARRVVDELRDRRDEVEARLALGQPSRQAARPYLRSAVRTALVPQIETTKAVGIVFLPGAMTGLVLAGVDPVDAVLVQVVVMYLVLASVSTTTTVVAVGLSRRLFTPDHRLVRLARPAD